jgi:hypothetical protein
MCPSTLIDAGEIGPQTGHAHNGGSAASAKIFEQMDKV